MEQMTMKELEIIGEAYQKTHDERIRLLNNDANRDIFKITKIADTWVHFPKITKLENGVDDGTFKLLYVLAKDIDKLDDIVIMDTEDDAEILLAIMKTNVMLHKPMVLSELAVHLTNCKGKDKVRNTIRWLLNYELGFFNHIIKELNKGSDDYFSYEKWLEFPVGNFSTTSRRIFK